MASSLYVPSWAAGNSSGVKEHLLAGAPSIVAQEDAPVLKGLDKVDAKAYKAEWLTDALVAADIPTAPVFDAEPSYTYVDSRSRLGNWVEEFIKTFTVSEFHQIVAKGGGVQGVPDEMLYGLEKKVKELYRDIERTLMSEQAGAADDDSTGATLEGFFAAVNNTDANDKTTTTGTAFYASISEDDFQNEIKSLFDAGIEGDLWCVAPSAFMMHVARNYKGRVDVVRETQTRDASKVNMKVEMYQAPVGGLVTFQTDRSMSEGVALIAKEYAKIGEARGVTVKRTDNDTQHKRGFVNWYGTLVIRNIAAHSGWKSDNTEAT